MQPIYKSLHIVQIEISANLIEAAIILTEEKVAPVHMQGLETLGKESKEAAFLHWTLSAISDEKEAVLFILPMGADAYCVALYTKCDRTVTFVNAKCNIKEETIESLKECFRLICRPLQQNKLLKFIWMPQRPFKDISAVFLLPIAVIMLKLHGQKLIDIRREIENNGTATLQQELHKHAKRSWTKFCTFRRTRYILEFADFLSNTLQSSGKSYLEIYVDLTKKKKETLFKNWSKEQLKIRDPAPWLHLKFSEVDKWLYNLECLRLEMDNDIFQRCLPNGMGTHLRYKSSLQEQHDPTPLLYTLGQDDLLAWRDYFIKYDR